jgi:ATP adenylyltransferase
MDSLHAPWRIQYVLAPKPPVSDRTVSVFTKMAQAQDDVAHYIVRREKSCFAVLNAYPYAGGHLLVVPYKQVADLDGLTDDEMSDLMQLTRRCQRVLTRVMKPDGFNIGLNLGRVAGAGIVEHLHWHIVPRWNGDTNFMPIIGQTQVLPENCGTRLPTCRPRFDGFNYCTPW